ncbi:MAG: hypothetical protein R2823_07840 [Acidimicrobiia bacterium]
MFHLARRFFAHLRATVLSDDERAEVLSVLSPELADLFFGMCHGDQRHAYEVYRGVGAEPCLAEAALLHDIGKTGTPCSGFVRALITVITFVGVPVHGSWARYRDHGTLGADLLEASGADAVAIAFTRHHPGPRPDSVDSRAWNLLERADRQ